ncbi:MarR family winged helix-turn-helix transcriptional regulator [Amphibiibacter pelophylacis]|uniref:MarR family transcriptional regulator n=1 Tax=Amphibiibacter pelophylacis TaxID=1799477 RepID=A0ACC6P2B4_9BURK
MLSPRDREIYDCVLHLVMLSRGYRAHADRELDDFGLSQAAAWALLVLWRLGNGQRQVTLAEHVGIEGSTLVRHIDQLVEAGLMQRQDDPTDRRAKTLHLTPAGEERVQAIEARLLAFRSRSFEGLSLDDIAACRRVMAHVADNLGLPIPAMRVGSGCTESR